MNQSKQRFKPDSKLVPIGAMWKKKNKKTGQTYLAGQINEDVSFTAGSGLLILPNAYKNEGENRPDYNVMMPEPAERKDTPGEDVEDDL